MKRIALADTRLWMDGDYTGNTAADAAATVPLAKSATYTRVDRSRLFGTL